MYCSEEQWHIMFVMIIVIFINISSSSMDDDIYNLAKFIS